MFWIKDIQKLFIWYYINVDGVFWIIYMYGTIEMRKFPLFFWKLQSLFKTFAITFSTMAFFVGTPLYGPSLLYAGPASLIWGYVVVTCFTWFVGFAMAEICSSFPVCIILFFFFFSFFSNVTQIHCFYNSIYYI